jgi:hypothetical protein
MTDEPPLWAEATSAEDMAFPSASLPIARKRGEKLFVYCPLRRMAVEVVREEDTATESN